MEKGLEGEEREGEESETEVEFEDERGGEGERRNGSRVGFSSHSLGLKVFELD